MGYDRQIDLVRERLEKGTSMGLIDQAQSRIRQREYEEQARQKKANEYQAAHEQLNRELHLDSFENEKGVRYAKRAHLRAIKKELAAMEDEEFGLSEQYNNAVGDE